MDLVTQQNAAMVEESTAAARSLSSETTELTELVSYFKVDESADTAVAAAPQALRSASTGASRRAA